MPLSKTKKTPYKLFILCLFLFHTIHSDQFDFIAESDTKANCHIDTTYLNKKLIEIAKMPMDEILEDRDDLKEILDIFQETEVHELFFFFFNELDMKYVIENLQDDEMKVFFISSWLSHSFSELKQDSYIESIIEKFCKKYELEISSVTKYTNENEYLDLIQYLIKKFS